MKQNIWNINKTIKSIFLILFLYMVPSIIAQTDTIKTTINFVPPVIKSEENVTSSSVLSTKVPNFRVPDEERIEKFREDNRFQYDMQAHGLSWWNKFKMFLKDQFNRIFGTAAKSGLLGYIILIVVVLLIVFIILKIAGIDYKQVIGRKKLDTEEIEIYSENVHEMNFDSLISSALKNKNYRLAIRFMYLKNLKALTDKRIINWDANKTNTSYLYEIQDENIRGKFIDTTLIFDYVWYGDFPIDENSFSAASEKLNELNKMVN